MGDEFCARALIRSESDEVGTGTGVGLQEAAPELPALVRSLTVDAAKRSISSRILVRIDPPGRKWPAICRRKPAPFSHLGRMRGTSPPPNQAARGNSSESPGFWAWPAVVAGIERKGIGASRFVFVTAATFRYVTWTAPGPVATAYSIRSVTHGSPRSVNRGLGPNTSSSHTSIRGRSSFATTRRAPDARACPLDEPQSCSPFRRPAFRSLTIWSEPSRPP